LFSRIFTISGVIRNIDLVTIGENEAVCFFLSVEQKPCPLWSVSAPGQPLATHPHREKPSCLPLLGPPILIALCGLRFNETTAEAATLEDLAQSGRTRRLTGGSRVYTNSGYSKLILADSRWSWARFGHSGMGLGTSFKICSDGSSNDADIVGQGALIKRRSHHARYLRRFKTIGIYI